MAHTYNPSTLAGRMLVFKTSLRNIEIFCVAGAVGALGSRQQPSLRSSQRPSPALGRNLHFSLSVIRNLCRVLSMELTLVEF